jgi:putative ABC transport system ATP-binding protein
MSAVVLDAVRFGWSDSASLLAIERFVVAQGEHVFLYGPSGSGKSTLLGLIGGVLTPRAGTITVLGAAFTDLSASARDHFRGAHIGFIFQMFNLIPYLSVRQNVMLPLAFSSERKARIGGDAEDEARRLLGALGLSDAQLLERQVTELSIGQQQRVAAARALMGRPGLIVADEPTSALDADRKSDFLKLLALECRSHGTTLIFVSHDTSLAPCFDRTVSLQEINRERGRPS